MNLETPPRQPEPSFPGLQPAPGNDVPAAPGRHARLIRDVRRQQRSATLLSGALWGCVAALGCFLLAGAVSILSPKVASAIIDGAPLVGLAVFGWQGLWRMRRTVGDDERTARLLANRVPGLSLDLLGGLELGRALRGNPDFSPELAEAFLRDLDRRAAAVDVRKVIDLRPLRRSGLAVLVAALALLAMVFLRPLGFFKGLPATAEPGKAKTAQKAREPITGDIELTYRYPAYTGLAMKTVPNTTGEISAPVGTEVTLKTLSDRAVERAQIVVNGQAVPLHVRGERALQGAFLVNKSGHYTFEFLAQNGKRIAQGPDTPITAQPDLAPKVSILTPPEQVEVSPKQQVTVRYEAEDDYGLTSLALVYTLPGDAKEQRVPLRHDEGRRSNGQYVWDLGPLPLNPGERITYHVEAIDNDEAQGKKKGVSRTQVLKVYSAEEHRRAGLAKAEQLWNRLIGLSADRMEGPDRDPRKDRNKVAGQGTVDAAGEALANDFIHQSRELARDPASPKPLLGALLNIGDGLQRKVRQTGDARRLYLRLQDRFPDFHPDARLSHAVDAEVAEEERDILYLEALLDKQKLEALKQLARELANDRRSLAGLIEQFQKTKDPQLQQEILRKAEALKQRMNELMQRMAELAKGIRDEHLNAEALAKMAKDKDMRGGIDDVEKLIREGKTEEALKKLQQLGMQMDQLEQQLGNAQDQAGQGQFGELGKKVRQFAEQLEKTSQAQKQLAEQTRQLRDRYRKQQLDQLRKRGQQLKQQLQKEIDGLKKDYQAMRADHLPPRSETPLEQVRSELENLQKALSLDDFDLATEAVDRAENAASELSADAERQREMDQVFQNPREVRQQSERTSHQLAQDADRVRKIQQKLHQLFPPPGSMMSQKDQQKLQELAQQQRNLRNQAQQLQQQMQDIGQAAPVFGQQGSEQLESVGQQMGQAAERLEGRDPGRGYGPQQSALDGLQKLKRQMEQAGKGGGSGGGLPMPMFAGEEQGGGDGSEASQEKVELPDPDASQGPKELRKDLMDAMKQGAPDKYKEQVKDYYEELVK